ncbi:Bax inhibitor-1/YccA family protein [Aeromicrobium massiliense]|uniref:Bax inhibitor-1/YccA family protein n=1 Tax=Aeromicrobium massiliense TaxID=1464554 RepID=UPI0002F4A6E6|nr:Bax inhibitor-1/YccA family protein [Aeromicrobium massiliense]
MQSSNPVFSRSEEFNGRGQLRTDPSQWQIDLNGEPTTYGSQSVTDQRRMTIDSVVEKTAITLGLVAISAAVTWFLIGDIAASDANIQKAWTFAMGGALIGFVLSMVNSFKKVISPALVMAYAVAEGAFVGAFSKVIANMVGDQTIVFQAVLATIVAFAATLGAYKFFDIQVTAKFRKVVLISMFAFVGVMLVNWILSLTGVLESGGLRSFDNPGLSLLVSGIAVVLAVFMLILDFDYVEQGVRAGLPERESWRAAFGLTVTLVWLYLELLRILAILRGDD